MWFIEFCIVVTAMAIESQQLVRAMRTSQFLFVISISKHITHSAYLYSRGPVSQSVSRSIGFGAWVLYIICFLIVSVGYYLTASTKISNLVVLSMLPYFDDLFGRLTPVFNFS